MLIRLDKSFFVLILFMYIYYIPILPVSVLMIGSIFFSFAIVLNYKIVSEYINTKILLHIILVILCLWFYLCAVSIKNGLLFSEILDASGDFFYLIFFTIFGMIILLCAILKNGYSRENLLDFIIRVGLMQSIIAICAFLFSPFQTFLCSFLTNIMDYNEVLYWKDYRLYGLSGSMTYGMPIVQAIIGGISFVLAEKKGAKYYIYSLLIWLSGIINARVAIVVIIIEILFFAFKNIFFKRILKKRNLIILIGFILLLLTIWAFISLSGVNISRLTDPFIEIIAFISGNEVYKTNGIMAYFRFNERAFVMPGKGNILLGEGLKIGGSDIGYISFFWRGGIVYSMTVYLFYFILLQKWKKSDTDNKDVASLLQVVLYVVHIKGNAFLSVSDFLNLFYLLMGFSVLIINEKNGYSI